MPSYCHKADKRRFRTYEDAVRALHRAAVRRGAVIRVYHCHHCTGWHLTRSHDYGKRRGTGQTRRAKGKKR